MFLLCSIFLIAVWPQVTGAGLATSSWNPAGGQAGAAFGSSVAPAGDVNGDGYSDVLVGAPLYDNGQADEGRVYLYLGSVDGLATSPAWTFEPNQSNAHAGAVLGSAGDMNYDGYADVLVGAPDYDRPGHADAGVVFVFYGTAQGLHAAPDDTLANDVTGSHFGASLSYAGYTGSDVFVDVVIGAPDYSNGQGLEGAVYVFQGGAQGLVPGLVFESNQANARTGASVSGGCDLNCDGFADIAIGEPGAAPGGHPAAGRVIVLPGSSGGVTTTPIATIDGTQDSLAVGSGVAFTGDVDSDSYAELLVGSPGESLAGTRKGVFRCWRGSGSGLDPTPLFSISGYLDQGRVGAAVATAGDLDGDGYADFVFPDPTGFPNHAGVVNVFYGGRPNTAYATFVGGIQVNSRFGASAATAGDVDADGYSDLIVGAPDGGTSLEGTAYLFLGRPALPSISINVPRASFQASSDFGASLAILPSLGWGFYPKLLVGEPGFDDPTTNVGRVRRYAGALTGFGPNTFDPVLAPGAGDNNFGYTVVTAGDVDRDGFVDFVAGSPFYTSNGIVERGRALLYLGNGANWTLSPWTAEGTQSEEFFGKSIACGDVNGDGYSDIAVGGYDFGTQVGGAGKVSVYLGAPGGPLNVPSWTRTGTVQLEYFGSRVAMLDFDADGYQDLAVAAASVNTAPRVDIFYGGPGGLSSNPAFSLSAIPSEPSYASEIAGVGDFNCDGVEDLVVGAPGDGAGRIWFYAGSRARSKPPQLDIRTWSPSGAGVAAAGSAIAGGGDVDGDGRQDFVVGAPNASHPEDQEGLVYLFRGRPGMGAVVPDTLYESDVALRHLGRAIAPLADLSSDGIADVVASASGPDGWLYAWVGGGEGAYLGNYMSDPSGGRRYSPALMDSANRFAWSQVMRSPAGRARVTTQIEARLQGTPFTALPTQEWYFLLDTPPPTPLGSVTGGGYFSSGLYTRGSYHVRGRTAFNSPYFPHTRWVTPEGRANVIDFSTGGTVTAAPGAAAGPVARLGRIAPNPSYGATRIPFELPGRVAVRLDVFDVRGRLVRTLARESAESGVRTWDGTDVHGTRVSPGLYFVELRVGDQVDRGRIVLLN